MSETYENLSSKSLIRLSLLQSELIKTYQENKPLGDVCIYACGSLGRLEMTDASDLDVFFILPDSYNDSKETEKKQVNNLDKYCFFSALYEVCKKLEYPDPSKAGKYWEFIKQEDLLDIGSRNEDYNNSFTARMLLILESKPLYNKKKYDLLVEDTIKKYFVDFDDCKERNEPFYPLFLMNDILRYWYTLTLNFEYRRDINEEKSKKIWKRLKLKYARLITCYSMLSCLYNPDVDCEYVISCVKKTPFERLKMLGNQDVQINEIVQQIESSYGCFLDLRKKNPDWWLDDKHKKEAFIQAGNFHDLVIHKLMKKRAEGNQELHGRTDIY